MAIKGVTVKETKEYAMLKEIALKHPMKESFTEVGIHEDAEEHPVTNSDGEVVGSIHMADLGAIHEDGAEIKNGFGKGIKINIPARHWLRGWIDEAKSEINKVTDALAEKVLSGKLSMEHAFGRLGEFAVAGIRTRIGRRLPPPLSINTLVMRRNGGDTPLWDTGGFVKSIDHKEHIVKG